MPKYPVLTPFRFKDTIYKDGLVTMDERNAEPYLKEGLIGPAMAESKPAAGTSTTTGNADIGAGDPDAGPDGAQQSSRTTARPNPAAGQPRR